MKKLIYLGFLLLFSSKIFAQSVTIDAANPSNIIKTESSNQGVLVPKMSYLQKNQIPILQRIEGMMVYDTDAQQFSYWTGITWINFGNASNNWTTNGANISNTNAGNVGISTPAPVASLDINGDLATRMANMSLNAGINNNLATTINRKSVYRIVDPTADFSITGIDGGVDGRVITLVNTTNFNMTLANESAASIGNNRILISNGTQLSVGAKAIISLQYSTVENRWFVTGKSSDNKTSWGLNGNVGTNPITDFIGTTDNQPLNFRQNNFWLGSLNNTTKNYFLGADAGKTHTGTDNIAIGANALNATSSSSGSVGIGTEALSKNIQNYNVAIGNSALKNNINGSGMIAIGEGALQNSVTNGSSNAVAIGQGALKNDANTHPYEPNTAVGSLSLTSNIDGGSNAAFGLGTLYNNVSGSGNTALGFNSMRLSQGNNNVAVGIESLYNTGAGNGNVGLGFQAIKGNIGNNTIGIGYQAALNGSSDKSIAIGYQAGFSNLRNQTIAIGDEALLYNSLGGATSTQGIENTAIGSAAMHQNQKGNSNTGVGYQVLYNIDGNTTVSGGNQNTAFGTKSLYNNFKGSQNTGIGYNTSIENSYGSSLINNSTAIGANAQVTIPNAIVLGSIAGINGATNNIKVGIGTTSPNEALHVVGNGLFSGNVGIGGNLSVTGTSTISSNESIGGNLGVTGISNLHGTDITGNLGVTGISNLHNTGVTGDLNVTGNSNLHHITVDGNLGVSGDVNILGDAAVAHSSTIGTNLIVNNNANIAYNTTIGNNLSVNGNVGIGITPAANEKLAVNGNIKTTEGIYSVSTGGFNLVPLGVINYWSENQYDGLSNDGGYENLAGNLCQSSNPFANSNLTSADDVGITLHLDPTICSQYSKLIIVGTPSFYGKADLSATNTVMVGYIQEFGTSGSYPNPTTIDYTKVIIKIRTEDFPQAQTISLKGTAIIYGIK